MRWGKQFHPIACCLYNISAKSYQNRLMHFEVIVCNITVVFETQCILSRNGTHRFCAHENDGAVRAATDVIHRALLIPSQFTRKRERVSERE